MARLQKREIIILAIAALFVLYAGYVYLIGDRHPVKKAKTGTESVKVETFVGGLADDLSKNKISDFDKYIIKRAEADWSKSPFLKRDLYRAWQSKDGDVGISLKMIYSGYVDSGKNKMAVINGIEYRIGEELKEEGYVLKHITPFKVIIFDKRTGSNFEIPIQE
ncbi:MAG: hypothetical protein LLG40_07020 [Deltaproteobacteria bacterium]|nr:hypothetical protein [Deltaproteobacteria bacterium]